jgi:hypothetical protein
VEIIEVFVEYPSGITISDRATLMPALDQVNISGRLASVIREFSITEAAPVISGRAAGRSLTLEANADGTLHVVATTGDVSMSESGDFPSRLLALIRSPTKDQRQQFGRFLHTLSAASLIGSIGFWHSTANWTASNILSEVNLMLAFVLTFYTGMVSMNGE